MGFLSDIVWLISEIVTFGGVDRLKDAKNDYNDAYEKYRKVGLKVDDVYGENKALLLDIGKHTESAFKSFRSSEKLLKKSIGSAVIDDKTEGSFSQKSITKIDKLNDRYYSVFYSGSGAAGGGVLAVGSWALISTVGAASTGTAISSLSGIAATNATLAWFGGGALAAGGAGIAGGTLVLGGIVAFPLIFIWGFTIHKKSKKLEDGAKRLNEVLPSISTELVKAQADNEIIKSKHVVICKACNDYTVFFEDTKIKLFQLGLLSHFYRHIKSLFGYSFYTIDERDVVLKLESETEKFMLLFETE